MYPIPIAIVAPCYCYVQVARLFMVSRHRHQLIRPQKSVRGDARTHARANIINLEHVTFHAG